MNRIIRTIMVIIFLFVGLTLQSCRPSEDDDHHTHGHSHWPYYNNHTHGSNEHHYNNDPDFHYTVTFQLENGYGYETRDYYHNGGYRTTVYDAICDCYDVYYVY